VAWDLSLRGLSVALVDRGDLAGGTSGRYHGLLHSGARYVVSDPATARECIQENGIVRRIARRAVDDTGGLFVLASHRGEAYAPEWEEGCRRAGIPLRELPREEALRREPGLDPGIRRAFEVPDAVCRSIPLCAVLRAGAESHGARFLTFHRLDGFLRREEVIRGVRLTDARTGEAREISCRIVVNAAGPWSGRVARLAGIVLDMDLARGAMLAFDVPVVKGVVNGLEPPGDGDVVLPRGRLSIAGTTTVPTDDPGDRRVEGWEVSLVRERSAALLPGLRHARLVHAWSAVRPLYDPRGRGGPGVPTDPRLLSRNFTVIDHVKRDGVEGLVTIVGGKLTLFRLMAEKTSDAVCAKLGADAACRTAAVEPG
jgi:glycerol-3-phosphate dehydrogenase